MNRYFENVDTKFVKVLENYETDTRTYPYALYDGRTNGLLCFDKGKSNNNYYAISTRADKKLKKHTACYNIVDVKTKKCQRKSIKNNINEVTNTNSRGPPFNFILTKNLFKIDNYIIKY